MIITSSQSFFQTLAPYVAIAVAAVSAAYAIKAYAQNTKTKTGEFLTALHQSFFVEPTYKKIRDTLDQTAKPELARALVSEESSDFTDFLNFFELAAYMRKRGNLSSEDVEALLGYYLQILKTNTVVYGYICAEKNGFEHLKKLLTDRKPNQLK